MVEEQISCSVYCLKIAINKIKKGDVEQAEFYIENARRSLREVKKAKELAASE